MPRPLTLALAPILALALAPAASAQEPAPPPPPAPAPPPPPPPEPRIAPGIAVGGVDVSNLTLAEATARLRPALAPKLGKRVIVAVAGKRYVLTPKQMRLTFDASKSARRAFNTGRQSPPPAGTVTNVAPFVIFRRAPIRDFANRVGKAAHVKARDATVRITLRRIHRRKSRPGRDLRERALRATIERTVVDPAAPRLLKPGRRATKPKITADELPSRYPTIITIDRSNFKLRLFKRLKFSKAYGVAVGAAGYDTPAGQYAIQTKQVNPAWSAPDKPWAGLYRGRTVPGGAPDNPLKARWLGIANGVGIHGTGDPGSIGSRASHGCIRMTVPDVIDLYPRVPIGTPVLIV